MTKLAESTILITGAASGLGRLMALGCAERSAQLVLWDRDGAGLAALHNELPNGPRIHLETVDLTDRDAIRNAVARTLAAGFEVDVLINNAGVVTGKPLLETSDADLERSFAVNALAPIRATRAFLPGMLARKRGHIVTVASAAGIVGTAKLVDYCASKHAAVGFDEALRLELKRIDAPVRTTVVCPYYIDTGMFAGVKTRFPWLLPIMQPESVARRILRAVERNEQRLILPWFVYSAFLVKVLPVPVFDWLLGFFGISKSMDEFKGRSAQTRSPAP
jgi:all-trans-retinol dehydrogenase (NAD+)